MTKVGHRKHHRQHVVKDVEAVVSLDDVSSRDVEEENWPNDCVPHLEFHLEIRPCELNLKES